MASQRHATAVLGVLYDRCSHRPTCVLMKRDLWSDEKNVSATSRSSRPAVRCVHYTGHGPRRALSGNKHDNHLPGVMFSDVVKFCSADENSLVNSTRIRASSEKNIIKKKHNSVFLVCLFSSVFSVEITFLHCFQNDYSVRWEVNVIHSVFNKLWVSTNLIRKNDVTLKGTCLTYPKINWQITSLYYWQMHWKYEIAVALKRKEERMREGQVGWGGERERES